MSSFGMQSSCSLCRFYDCGLKCQCDCHKKVNLPPPNPYPPFDDTPTSPIFYTGTQTQQDGASGKKNV